MDVYVCVYVIILHQNVILISSIFLVCKQGVGKSTATTAEW